MTHSLNYSTQKRKKEKKKKAREGGREKAKERETMTNMSSPGEMVYVEHTKDINGFPKVILRKVRGCFAEVCYDLCCFLCKSFALIVYYC